MSGERAEAEKAGGWKTNMNHKLRSPHVGEDVRTVCLHTLQQHRIF